MKKFVKGLLVSGFVVSLLAACNNKKSSCPACPEPSPEPSPVVKEAWTDEEVAVMASYYLEELPFGAELELSGASGGVLYATSKAEASAEDLNAYLDVIEGSRKYSAYDTGDPSHPLSYDVEELGFDANNDIVQYFRPYADNEETLICNFITVGLDENSHIQVAMATAYAPLYAYGIGGGQYGWPMLMTDAEEETGEYDFFDGIYAYVIDTAFQELYGAPSICTPASLAEYYELLPEFFLDSTYGYLTNSACFYPFTSGNVNSSEFAPKFEIIFENHDVKDKTSGAVTFEKIPYLYDLDFVSVVDNAIDSAIDYVANEDETEFSVYVEGAAGFNLELGYRWYEGNGNTAIGVSIEAKGFELPRTAMYIVSEIGESYNYNAVFDYDDEKDVYYSISAVATTEAALESDLAEAVDDMTDVLIELGYANELSISWSYDDGAYVAEFSNFTDQDYVSGAVLVMPYVIQGQLCVVVQVAGQDLTAEYYSERLYWQLSDLKDFIDELGLWNEYGDGLFTTIENVLYWSEDFSLNVAYNVYSLALYDFNQAYGAGVAEAAFNLVYGILVGGALNENDYTEANYAAIEEEANVLYTVYQYHHYGILGIDTLINEYLKVTNMISSYSYAGQLKAAADAIKKSGLFTTAGEAAIDSAVADGVAAIAAVDTRDEKSAAQVAALMEIVSVPTFEAEVKSALETRVAADFTDENEFSAEDWAAISGMVTAAQAAIDEAETAAEGELIADECYDAIYAMSYMGQFDAYCSSLKFATNYGPDGQTAFTAARDAGETAIDAAATREEKAQALADAMAALAEIPTFKAEYAEAFATFMEGIHEEDYSAANWALIQNYVQRVAYYLGRISNQYSASVMLDNFETLINDVPTEAEILAAAKLDALDALDDFMDDFEESAYSPENWAVIQGYLSDAETAINDATSVEAVEAALEQYEALISAVEPLPEP